MARAWDVLYALLAFHLKDLSRDGLLEGLQGVSEDASDSLPSRLVKVGILSSEEAELIRRLAEAATQAHDGNAEAAVMSLGGEESLWKSLDPDRTLSTPSGRTTTPMRITPFEVSQRYTIDPIEEIPGRYATTSEYGRGGMGRILLAHDLKMGRDIALKELLPTNETSMILPEKSPVRYTAAIAARFLQEGRVTAGLEHPSIVPVYEIGRRPNGNLYYTMKLVRGQSLARALRECKSLEERLSFLPHFVDLCEAVAYAHSRGVLHRDLKPSNIMIGEFGETVVLDWGLAKIKAHREDPLEKESAQSPGGWSTMRHHFPKRGKARPWERRNTCRRSRPRGLWSRLTSAPICIRWGSCCMNCSLGRLHSARRAPARRCAELCKMMRRPSATKSPMPRRTL